MRITATQQAPEHHVFAADAFTDQIGKHVPLRIDGNLVSGDVMVVDVVVAPDGSSADITYDVTLASKSSPIFQAEVSRAFSLGRAPGLQSVREIARRRPY